MSAWGIATVHASLGDVDAAYRWLDIADQEKAFGLHLLRVHPPLDPIRSVLRMCPGTRAANQGWEIRKVPGGWQ